MQAEESLGENAGRSYLVIARILRPQGRVGEVAAEVLTDFPERFQQRPTVLLGESAETVRPAALENAWPHKGHIILKFAGVDSIDSASRLRGLQVFVPWEDRTPLAPHHYYRCELEGCRVIGERDGKEIGTVVEVESTGGVDVLHVRRGDEQGEVLIPLAQEICTRIDIASRTIVITPPEELLDLNE